LFPINLKEDKKLARDSKAKLDTFPQVQLRIGSEKVAAENSRSSESIDKEKSKKEAEQPIFLRRY
jgi:hypothetical protein